MAETKEEITYRFEDIDDSNVKVSVIGSNGSQPFEAKLLGVTWGMVEDVMSMQEAAKEDMGAIFAFFNKYVEGGGSAVPLKYTLPFFEAIAQYMTEVMGTQKK